MSFPNQKRIQINKIKCDGSHPYAIINQWAMQSAMRNLHGSGFKLWCYLAKNQPGYCFDLSKEDCKINWGMSKDSYYAAVNELKEKRYLIETIKNHFDFYEIPDTLPQSPFEARLDFFRGNANEYTENPKICTEKP